MPLGEFHALLFTKPLGEVVATEPLACLKDIDPDGGFLVAGVMDVEAAEVDGWVAKIDAAGEVLWSTTLGGERVDVATGVAERPDGSIVAAGNFTVAGLQVPWVAELSATGAVQWQRSYDGERSESVIDLALDGDGTAYLAIIAQLREDRAGQILAVGSDGALRWQREFVKYDGGAAYAVTRAPRGGARLVLRWADSPTTLDTEVVELDRDGGVVWQRHHDTESLIDGGYGIATLPDGDYVLAGLTMASPSPYWATWLLRADPAAPGPCDDSDTATMSTPTFTAADGPLTIGTRDIRVHDAAVPRLDAPVDTNLVCAD